MEVQCFEIKTEADSNDITLCSRDDKPSTGMFAVTDSRGLVVTSGVPPEPSSQLTVRICISNSLIVYAWGSKMTQIKTSI